MVQPGVARRITLSRWTLLLLVLASACVGDGTGLTENGDPIGTMPPSGPPLVATLSQDVQPIFTANCALSGCHAGANPQLAQNLSTGRTFQSVVNVLSVQSSLLRVKPSEPDSSYLVHKVQGTHLSVGGSGGRMPLIGGPLSQTEIDLIRAWIADGAQDN